MRKVISTAVLLAGALMVALPSQASAEPPPDAESRVVFSNGGRIVSVDSNGSARKVLTRKGKPVANSFDFFEGPERYDRFPKISPDGSEVLFFRQTDFGETDSDFFTDGKTMVVKATGGRPRTLFGGGSRREFRDATWIPGSKNLLAVKRNGMMNSAVVEVTPKGRVVRTLLKLKVKRNGRPWWDLPTFFVPTELAVSPDGSRFLMTRQNAWINSDSNLELVNLRSGKRRLVRKAARQGRWSADGTRITFVSKGQGVETCVSADCRDPYDVFIADAGGRNVKRVKATHYDENTPSFAADGKSIVFSANRNKPSVDESREVYRMGVDGRCVDWLTNGTPASREPDWGPGSDATARETCRAPAQRRPLVEGKPGPLDTRSWGPRFWLGESVRGALPSSSITLFGASLIDYRDCGEFRRVDCPKPVMVAQIPVCLVGAFIAPALQVLKSRKVRKKVKGGKYRGVHFKTMYAGGQSFAMTFTGQSIVATMQKSGGVRSGRLDQLALLRRLQPVNGDAEGALPAFRVPRYTLRHARKVKRLVRNHGLNKTAKRLDVARWEVRSQLRLRRNLRQVGPVKPIRCATKRNLRSLVDFDSMSVAPSAARALENPALKNLGRSLPPFEVPGFVERMLQR